MPDATRIAPAHTVVMDAPDAADSGATVSVVDRVSGMLQRRSQQVQELLRSPVRDTRMAVVIGRMLALALVVCFATGVYSHLLQSPLPWLPLPTRPIGLYAWTQGIHVVSGSMLLPLLLAKLWTVYPRLFRWPPVRGAADLVERASIAVLVATALVVPVTGVLNALEWYPWTFSFRRTHFALSWMLMGALLVHIGVQLPAIRRHWRRDAGEEADDDR